MGNVFLLVEDIRTSELVQGRSINLALSARGRAALRDVGLEDVLLSHGIPMSGRMIHATNGFTQEIPYDVKGKQVINAIFWSLYR